MAQDNNSLVIRTGDGATVDEWVNNVWPKNAIQAIISNIPDWESLVTFRTAVKSPVISKSLKNCQLVINYNKERDCFVIWNATIQHQVHRRNYENRKSKLHLSMGSVGEKLLHQKTTDNFSKCYYREFGRGGSNCVELIWILGRYALIDFCKDYNQKLIPDPNDIPKGKTCLYAVAGGEIQYIPSNKEK